jgi:hypothetical protein
MEIFEPLVITRQRVARLVNGDEDLFVKYFRGSRAAPRSRSTLEIKSLAYEGGARNGAYRLSRISMRDYCPRG